MIFDPAMRWIAPITEKTAPASPAEVFIAGNERAIMKKNFWDGIRDAGYLLVDAKSRKVAVFPNTIGMVVLATTQDNKECICTLDVSEIDDLIKLLQEAKTEAEPMDAELQAVYAIHCAKMGEQA